MTMAALIRDPELSRDSVALCALKGTALTLGHDVHDLKQPAPICVFWATSNANNNLSPTRASQPKKQLARFDQR